MNLARKVLLFNVSRSGLVVNTVRRGTTWNKDWKPGPLPQSPEETAAAAKKYGLLPQEYRTAPDDGTGIGDYPVLAKDPEFRDPYYPWDYPELRRNYGEAIHPEDHLLYNKDLWETDRDPRPRFPMRAQIATFLATILGSYLLLLAANDSAFLPHVPKKYPGPGLTHYKYP